MSEILIASAEKRKNDSPLGKMKPIHFLSQIGFDREEATDPDFVCKTINNRDSSCESLLPVPKCGFGPLRPPNL
jgi:hypothetical protein